MYDLCKRMHTRVGTARANGAHALCRNASQRVFERILHRAARRLRLPAAKAAAVVFNAKCDSHRGTGPQKTKTAAV
jgi:hypothetical protein